MANLFLDANFVVDILQQRTQEVFKNFSEHTVYVSALSFHIFSYVGKRKMPDQDLIDFNNLLRVVDLSNDIVLESLVGPTKDFEDNVQLHSAAQAECDYFLTRDRSLLGMTFFGKANIVDHL